MLNLYNFMDRIDGLAGGEAAVASSFFFLVFAWYGRSCGANRFGSFGGRRDRLRRSLGMGTDVNQPPPTNYVRQVRKPPGGGFRTYGPGRHGTCGPRMETIFTRGPYRWPYQWNE